MGERMSAVDVSFFHLEGRTTPQHVGGIATFELPADGFDYDRLVRLLDERISLVPRYRQKMRVVPGRLANPVWVDDPSFDITYHVRRSALPRPGSDVQLLDFCARIQSRMLDRNRPLWEMYLVEGLSGGRVAICTKTHHSMVDGYGAIDIAQVILDASPQPRRIVQALWMPEPEPSGKQLMVEALGDVTRRPTAVLDVARHSVLDVSRTAKRASNVVVGMAAATAALLRTEPESPLHTKLGEQRRLAVARTSLSDFRRVRRQHGGTVNDVVLATIAGALRGWLLYRGEPVDSGETVRALVPVSMRVGAGSQPSGDLSNVELRSVPDADAAADGDRGARMSAVLVDLPVGEADPIVRLNRISFAMAAHTDSGRSMGADALASLSGFAPPTLHALGARAAHGLTSRMYSLVITNVPGPQLPLYAAGARMLEIFPILPLGDGKAVSIGLTSYDGGVFFGLNGDRDAMVDLGVLANLLEESLAELVELTPTVPVSAQTPTATDGEPLAAADRAATDERTVASEQTPASPRRGRGRRRDPADADHDAVADNSSGSRDERT